MTVLLTSHFLFIFCMAIGIDATSMVSADPPTSADCVSDVPFADPDNCTNYYQCFLIDATWYLVPLSCPTGGIWDDASKSCVEGTCEVVTTTTTTTTTTAATTTSTATTPTTTAAPDANATSETTTTASTTTTTLAPTTTGSTQASTGTTTSTSTVGPPTFECSSVGMFPHPTDPTKYYQCVLIGAQFYYYIYNCPPNSCFQSSAGMCVAGSCSGDSNTTTTSTPSTAITTTTPPVQIICNSQGSYPFPGSCTKYYKCILIANSFVYYVFECPPNSYFNPSNSLCTSGPCPSTPTTSLTTPTTTLSTTTSTTLPPDTLHPCPSEGYFSDPLSCQSYYRCIIINGQMYRYMYQCPANSYWNNNLQGCIVGSCPNAKNLLMQLKVEDTTIEDSTTSSPGFICTETGFFPHPTNCTAYVQCVVTSGQFYYYNYNCPPYTMFDATSKSCIVGVC